MPSKYQHRHYEDFAKLLGQHQRDFTDSEGYLDPPFISLRTSILDLFQRDNPRFDRDLFLSRALAIADHLKSGGAV